MLHSRISTRPAPDLSVPEANARLRDIAYNLWWTWSPQAQQLYSRLAPSTWARYRNPIDVLIDLGSQDWRALDGDEEFKRAYALLVEQFDAYMSPQQPTWFERNHGDLDGETFAYFSTEYGWHECLQIYSGGLGVLSGDHCKAASDLGVPLIGIGLMYKHGYFRQSIDAEGFQQHLYPDYDLRRLPLLPVVDRSGRELHVSVQLADRPVHLRVWRALVGRIPVLLLDSNLPINHPADRPITSILYVADREMRLCQEILLGMGGARVLEAMGITPAVWHLNEGHSALLSLQRIGMMMQHDRLPFEQALRRTASSSIFTTHTPVPAGNEEFDVELIRRYIGEWPGSAGPDPEQVLSLGRSADDQEDKFNLTALALRTSARANGVSELHGRVANGMWKPLLDGSGRGPIGHVTNGVHVATWIGPEMGALLRRYVGPALDGPDLDSSLADAIGAIPDHELWTAHLAQKGRLINSAREKILGQFVKQGRSPGELRSVEQLLDPAALTVAFARRFATYKRADLLIRDEKRLRALVASAGRPVQFIFSGKAHPADRHGQDLIRRISHAAFTPDLRGRLIFIENYDMHIARHLVQGVDVWLNTPRRPQEASGTSGMKAAVNGVLNCSIADGWWCEGYDPSHGWIIGQADDYDESREQDDRDTDSLYRVLSDEVAPTYYERNDQGLPVAWVGRMKRALGLLTPRFCAARMVREYVEKYYVPAQRGEFDSAPPEHPSG